MTQVALTGNNNIHLSLRDLLERKSEKDKKNFTIYQLAKAIRVPHSILVKLMHNDPSKRVHNPRIDTLYKIIDFFRNDGFDISIDNLLFGLKGKNEVVIDHQGITEDFEIKEIPVFQMSSTLQKKVGLIKTKLSSRNGNCIALLSDEDIKPIFKKGSFFIVDTLAIPENGNLVAVDIKNQKTILIRKLLINENKKILISFDSQNEEIELSKKIDYRFIGVVIQVNAKT